MKIGHSAHQFYLFIHFLLLLLNRLSSLLIFVFSSKSFLLAVYFLHSVCSSCTVQYVWKARQDISRSPVSAAWYICILHQASVLPGICTCPVTQLALPSCFHVTAEQHKCVGVALRSCCICLKQTGPCWGHIAVQHHLNTNPVHYIVIIQRKC